MTAHPTVGAWVESTLSIAAVYQPSYNECFLQTAAGDMLHINRVHQNGTYTTGGVAYALAKELPVDVEAAFAASAAAVPSISPPVQDAIDPDATRRRALSVRRQLRRGGGALMTSGSFTMMSSSGLGNF